MLQFFFLGFLPKTYDSSVADIYSPSTTFQIEEVENATMRYRSSTEIIDSMLRSMMGSGATKTRVMYQAYLSYSQMKGYLDLLEGRKLIVYDLPSERYKVTEKGMAFMKAYDEISELIPSIEENTNKKTPVANGPFNY